MTINHFITEIHELACQQKELTKKIQKNDDLIKNKLEPKLDRMIKIIRSVANKSFGYKIPEDFWKSFHMTNFAFAQYPISNYKFEKLSYYPSTLVFKIEIDPHWTNKQTILEVQIPQELFTISDRELAQRVKKRIHSYKEEKAYNHRKEVKNKLRELKRQQEQIQEDIASLERQKEKFKKSKNRPETV